MPAPWALGAQGRIVGELHGQQCLNVVHFATNSAGTDQGIVNDLLLALAAAMLECAIETLLPAVTSDYKLIQCDARTIAPTASDPIVATAPVDSNGELSVTSVSFAASLVHVRTGGGGKSGRGRMFLPPPGETQVANSTIDDPTQTLITAFLTCLAGKFFGANPSTAWRMGVLSQKILANNPANFDQAFRQASSLNPVATLAVMRSRKRSAA